MRIAAFIVASAVTATAAPTFGHPRRDFGTNGVSPDLYGTFLQGRDASGTLVVARNRISLLAPPQSEAGMKTALHEPIFSKRSASLLRPIVQDAGRFIGGKFGSSGGDNDDDDDSSNSKRGLIRPIADGAGHLVDCKFGGDNNNNDANSKRAGGIVPPLVSGIGHIVGGKFGDDDDDQDSSNSKRAGSFLRPLISGVGHIVGGKFGGDDDDTDTSSKRAAGLVHPLVEGAGRLIGGKFGGEDDDDDDSNAKREALDVLISLLAARAVGDFL